MKCSEVRAFLSQVNDGQEPISPIRPPDIDYLSSNGYVLLTTKEDHDKGLAEVSRMSQLIEQASAQRAETEKVEDVLRQDEEREHSFKFHFEGEQMKEELHERVEAETTELSKDEAELG